MKTLYRVTAPIPTLGIEVGELVTVNLGDAEPVVTVTRVIPRDELKWVPVFRVRMSPVGGEGDPLLDIACGRMKGFG